MDRELSIEAQRILNEANSMFDEPRYRICWARHVDGDNKVFDAWVIIDEVWGNACDDKPYDDQNCVAAAKIALEFARENRNEQ